MRAVDLIQATIGSTDVEFGPEYPGAQVFTVIVSEKAVNMCAGEEQRVQDSRRAVRFGANELESDVLQDFWWDFAQW